MSNFDKNLNCITGLNGSGKSNVLDAICFVLGLQSFSLARVEKLQEFIYKNGQSGITEAKVSIVFEDNTGRLGKQIWSGSNREVVVSRSIKRDRSKFTLNGKRVTMSSVKKLFKSIGLNMDNPSSFFVKQGTVSNIVHFKSRDLLELVEECAGVNYYNGIRQQFVHVVGRQDRKIMSIEDIYSGDLHPEVLRLKREVEVLGQYQRGQVELKVMTHFKEVLKRALAEGKIGGLQQEVVRKTQELKLGRLARREARGNLDQLQGKITKLDKDLKHVKGTLENADFQTKKKKLENTVLKIQTFEKRNMILKRTELERITGQIAEFQKTIEQHSVTLRLACTELESVKDQIETKQIYLEKLKGNLTESSKIRTSVNPKNRVSPKWR